MSRTLRLYCNGWVSPKMFVYLVLVLVCVLCGAKESQGKAVMGLNTTSTHSESQKPDLTHSSKKVFYYERNKVLAYRRVENRFKRNSDNLFQEMLMLTVTVLKQSVMPGDRPVTFWADSALVSMTVIVETHGDRPMSCVLANRYGDMPDPKLSGAQAVRWDVQRPPIGAWHLYCESDHQYDVIVEGISTLDLEVSLYHTDVSTGLAEPVQNTPTAGHEIRTIVDVIGHDYVNSLVNVTLMTSDGRELGSDWMRHAGSPTDPQYQTTFTWPAEPVYIRVLGQEKDGSYFERQLPYLITPKLVDLELQGDPAGVVHPGEALIIRFVLTNRGPADSFLMNASVDNPAFIVSVSPAYIRLGHLSSFEGRVSVNVNMTSSSDTGLLHLTATNVSNPAITQTVTRLLSAEDGTADRTPPFCHVISATGNCSKLEESVDLDCHEFDWTVHASVMDVDSGLQSVRFAAETSDDDYVISPFSQGQANEPVVVSYRTSCCTEAVPLDVSDMEGNEFRCEFLQMDIVSNLGGTDTFTTTLSPRKSSDFSLPTRRQLLQSDYPPTSVNTGLTRQESAIPATDSSVTSNPSIGSVLGPPPVNNSAHLAPRGSKKQHWDDYSTLKTVSIALGAVGGLAGLTIVFLCSVYYYRYRRLRQRRYSDNSDDGNGRNIDNDHHRENRRSAQNHNVTSRSAHAHNVPPDILPSVARREIYNTSL